MLALGSFVLIEASCRAASASFLGRGPIARSSNNQEVAHIEFLDYFLRGCSSRDVFNNVRACCGELCLLLTLF